MTESQNLIGAAGILEHTGFVWHSVLMGNGAVGNWVSRGGQVFEGVKRVQAFGGAGNDRIVVSGTVGADAQFERGAGSDELSLRRRRDGDALGQ